MINTGKLCCLYMSLKQLTRMVMNWTVFHTKEIKRTWLNIHPELFVSTITPLCGDMSTHYYIFLMKRQQIIPQKRFWWLFGGASLLILIELKSEPLVLSLWWYDFYFSKFATVQHVRILKWLVLLSVLNHEFVAVSLLSVWIWVKTK